MNSFLEALPTLFSAGQIRPYADCVLVLMDLDVQTERTSAGGIVLPSVEVWGKLSEDKVKQRLAEPCYATVVAVGPGAYMTDDERLSWWELRKKYGSAESTPKKREHWWPTEVQPGDRVLVDHRQSGEPVLIDLVEHRMVRNHNLLFVLDEV